MREYWSRAWIHDSFFLLSVYFTEIWAISGWILRISNKKKKHDGFKKKKTIVFIGLLWFGFFKKCVHVMWKHDVLTFWDSNNGSLVPLEHFIHFKDAIWHRHTMEYYPAFKWNKSHENTIVQMDLKDIGLSEIIWLQQILCDPTYARCVSRSLRSTKT